MVAALIMAAAIRPRPIFVKAAESGDGRTRPPMRTAIGTAKTCLCGAGTEVGARYRVTRWVAAYLLARCDCISQVTRPHKLQTSPGILLDHPWSTKMPAIETTLEI